jgi:hypothetical protein
MPAVTWAGGTVAALASGDAADGDWDMASPGGVHRRARDADSVGRPTDVEGTDDMMTSDPDNQVLLGPIPIRAGIVSYFSAVAQRLLLQ